MQTWLKENLKTGTLEKKLSCKKGNKGIPNLSSAYLTNMIENFHLNEAILLIFPPNIPTNISIIKPNKNRALLFPFTSARECVCWSFFF